MAESKNKLYIQWSDEENQMLIAYGSNGNFVDRKASRQFFDDCMHEYEQIKGTNESSDLLKELAEWMNEIWEEEYENG